jgi:hypothetical protein
MTSLRSFGLMAGMARDKIGSSLADGLTGLAGPPAAPDSGQFPEN